MYIINQIIQYWQGNNHVRICSPGASGTQFLKGFFKKHVRLVSRTETHKPYSLEDQSVNKLIYIYANPLNVLTSYFNRNQRIKGWTQRHCENMDGLWNDMNQEWTLKEYLEQEKDLFGLKTHLKKWKSMETNYPIMFIKYETMWDHLEEIFDFLEIPRAKIKNFPKKKGRKSNYNDLELSVKDELLKQYGGLYEEFLKEKEIWIKEPGVRV